MAKAKISHGELSHATPEHEIPKAKAEVHDNGTQIDQTDSAAPTEKAGHGEKSEIIRQIIASGITKPALIIEEAASRGVTLNAGLVNSVKSKHLGGKVRAATATGKVQSLDLNQILALNKRLAAAGGSEQVLQAFALVEGFVREFGSLEIAKQAIDDLEKLKEGLR